MTALSEFMDRVSAVSPHDIPDREMLDDDVMLRAGAIAKPFYAQRAERADVDLDDLQAQIGQMLHDTRRLTIARMMVGDPVRELAMFGTATGLQFFLLGVLWEQERHLPDLDPS